MKIDLLILQLAIIFLPGLIWARLDARYALKSKPSDTEFLLRAFVFGMGSYAATFFIYAAVGWQFIIFDVGSAGSKEVITREAAWEIAVALIAGMFLSVIWIYAATYKWLTRFLQMIRATKKYG